MAIAAFLTAQLPARTMSSQCCCFLLYLPNLSWKGRVYMSVYMSVYLSVWARVWGFVGLEETLPCAHTKALCLQQGNDTLAEQKKLNTMLASVPSWSYDTGKKNRTIRASPISENQYHSKYFESWEFVPMHYMSTFDYFNAKKVFKAKISNVCVELVLTCLVYTFDVKHFYCLDITFSCQNYLTFYFTFCSTNT